jgi:hypothetical protein
MDKKAKKRLDIIHQKLQQLRQRLAGTRKLSDEPGVVQRVEAEIAALESESRKLRDEQ